MTAAHATPQRPKSRRSEPVDERVGKAGGYRLSNGNYQFPGMSHPRDWGKTRIHESTYFYACALCGVRFTGEGGPQAVYVHLAKRHNR